MPKVNLAHRRSLSAFSLPEILIVISIVMILGGLLVPALQQAKARAYENQCISNLGQIYRASLLYMAEYDDRFPRGKDCIDVARPTIHPPEVRAAVRAMPLLVDLLQPYAKSRAVFGCPVDSGIHVLERQFPLAAEIGPQMFRTCGQSYEYRTEIGLVGVTGTSLENTAGVNLLADAGGHWHGYGAALLPTDNRDAYSDRMYTYRYSILYADGHAKSESGDELYQAWGRH